MNGVNGLPDLYHCCICDEPMKSAVSLNPCGHELDQTCAAALKKCPFCRVDVTSFRPAFITRQAVEALLKNMERQENAVVKEIKQEKITVHVHRLTGQKFTYKMGSAEKTINVFKLLFNDTKLHPSRIELVCNRKQVSLFGPQLSDYVPQDKTELTFYMKERLGHWTQIAEHYPLIFQKAVAQVGPLSKNLNVRFLDLYNQAVEQAMKD